MPIERLSVNPDATSRLDGGLCDKAIECFVFNNSQTKSVVHMHDNPLSRVPDSIQLRIE